MSEVDLQMFCEHEKAHIKEGIVTVEEDNGLFFNLKVQQVAVQLFYGKKVRSDDLLKISQTGLEGILASEITSNGSQDVTLTGGTDSRKKRPRDMEVGDSVELDDADDADGSFVSTPARKNLRVSYSGHSSRTPISHAGSSASNPSPSSGGRKALIHGNGIALQRQLSHNSYFAGDRASFDHQDEHMAEEDMDVSMDTPAAKASEVAADNFASPLALNASLVTTDDSESSIKPYDSADQLDYLEDGFQLVSLMIKTNSAKLKDDLKKEGTSNANMWHDSSADNKFSNRELSAKIKLHEKRIAARLRRTEESGQTLPRLETLMSKFEADAFEKRLVLLLIGLTVSPIVRTLVDNMKNGHPSDPTISVGDALSILCADFRSQLTHRKYFYQSSRLLRNGVISLLTSRWREGTGDLTENRLALDRRILDWSVGLDTEINELVQGSDLYQPVVQLNQVILPQGYMERILSQCYAYDEYTLYQQASADENKLSYGNSLVILLCGKSGTGKTMTVNAVAKELGKKVLLVDFQSLLSRRGQGDAEVDLKGLFREAKMSNAVLFFDECETIFRGRHVGADRTLNSLLTEMERHCGIVFLATNRPHEIDEAMHRRITMVLEYQEPSVAMRRQIWDNLLRGIQLPEAVQTNSSELESATEESQKEKTVPTLSTGVETTAAATGTSSSSPTATDALLDAPSLVNVIKREKASSVRSLTLADDVETPVLASKYALTGGFIKNAVLSATLIAMSRDKVHPVISQADLIEGSRMQMRGNLSRNVFKVIAPESRKRSLQRDLFVPEATRLVLQKILQFENTRSKIYGTWNFTAANLGNDSNGNDSANSISNSTGNVSNSTTSSSSSSSSSSSGNAIVQPQHACINLLAGSRGSGKATIFRTVASELGNRKIKYVHVAELQGDQLAHSTELFQALVLDAAILDAVIVIDGFEKILESGAEESGAGVSSLHLMLSRMMDILYSFPGCIFLLAHIDNPQNVDLKRYVFTPHIISFLSSSFVCTSILLLICPHMLESATSFSSILRHSYAVFNTVTSPRVSSRSSA